MSHNQIHRRRCLCGYVPPYVLDHLAKSGEVPASIRDTIQQTALSRKQRATKSTPMDTFRSARTGVGGAGDAPRKVHNCQNKWQQHSGPARGEGEPAAEDISVNRVYDLLGEVRKYLSTRFERKSWDNLGGELIASVHYGEGYNNAFWDGDELTFGDGDNVVFTNLDKSPEVVAHELGHGIVQTTANLIYEGQPGALNEHFADVIGTIFNQGAKEKAGQAADWLIGDEVMTDALSGEALRSMRAPGTAFDNALMGTDPQPDHMAGYYAGPDDNYGVHINSGIPNKAFYLTCQDIGIDNAARIWYHALQNLWTNADFNAAVARLVLSARVLVKDNKVPPGSPQAVRAAFKAVGLPQ